MSTMNDARMAVLNTVPSAYDPGATPTKLEELTEERNDLRLKLKRAQAHLVQAKAGPVDNIGNPETTDLPRKRAALAIEIQDLERTITQLEQDLARNGAERDAAEAAESNEEANGR